jgi:hypothetical protein
MNCPRARTRTKRQKGGETMDMDEDILTITVDSADFTPMEQGRQHHSGKIFQWVTLIFPS